MQDRVATQTHYTGSPAAAGGHGLALAALLFAAAMWGIIWFPYRLLAGAGVPGQVSTLATYAVALAMATLAFPGAWRDVARAPGALVLVALAAGVCNLCYVMGILSGEVMRVLLLFYLAPLWSIPLARLVLGERVTRVGYAVIALAFAGALVMLWNPAAGAPWPATRADWLGLLAGFAFAFSNVLVRRARGCGVAARTLAVLAGVLLVSLVAVLASGTSVAGVLAHWPLVAATAAGLVTMSLAIQFGLSHIPATRAVVILLFELIVAALAAWYLAGEMLRPQDWAGGAMIIAASLGSGRITHHLGA